MQETEQWSSERIGRQFEAACLAFARWRAARQSTHVVLPWYARNLDVPDGTFCQVCGLAIKNGSAVWYVHGYIHPLCSTEMPTFEQMEKEYGHLMV